MAKLTRLTAKVFGETADGTLADPEIGQFGSAKAGTYNGTGDVATIQSLPAWSNGWVDAVTPRQQFPPLPEMTGVHKVLSYQEAYLLQQGIAEWDSATTYYTNNFCAKGAKIYISKTNNNLNHDPASDTVNWQEFFANGANVSLSNLNTLGNSKLHALKGYLDEGELLTDIEGLADVKYYAHSTFDSTKFTKVGSPTITDDGIASGLSTSNYLTKANAVTILSGGEFRIDYKFSCSQSSSIQYIFNLYNSQQNDIFMRRVNSSNAFYCSVFSGGTQVFAKTITDDSGNYEGYLEYKNGAYTWKLNNNAETVTANPLSNLAYSLSIGARLSTGTATEPLTNGSIDLKYISIHASGAPVFSGNKTGIDTIKPDNYTVVGSPTISADGIASGFGASSYIEIPDLDISSAGDFELESVWFKLGSIASGINQVQNWSGTYTDTRINIYQRASAQDKIEYAIYHGATVVGSQYTFDASLNTWYQMKFVYKNSEWNIYYRTQTTNWVLTKTLSDSTPVTIDGARPLGWEQASNYLQNGELDLNGMQIYVNGSLIYQPCLKIPYTQSKTGSKMVDSYYRSRVTDMATQEGYAPYYTLSDTNYTLPQGEVYGMMNIISEKPIHIVETYTNGADGYVKYSNGLIDQWGVVSLSAGNMSTKNFLIAFSDTNYNIQATTNSSSQNNATMQVASSSETQFIIGGGGSSSAYWRAVGY